MSTRSAKSESPPQGGPQRPRVAALEKLLGSKLSVLDDGFVRLIDYMGDDASVVQAARISYGTGTRKTHEDRGLIRYLMRQRHTTPFEMCEIKLHVRVPMDTWRQWIRHRTANVNEYSTRYSIAIDAAQRTLPEEWRLQSTVSRQGSEGCVRGSLGRSLSEEELELQERARAVYQSRIDAGVAREQARKDLPLSTYTEAYWKIDLWNLLHFMGLRMHQHAQHEIREYAKVIGERLVAPWVPHCWEAFVDYRLKATILSRLECAMLKLIVAGVDADLAALARDVGWLKQGTSPGELRGNRERVEFDVKLMEQFGLSVDWPGLLTRED